MREVRIAEEIISHAIVDGINKFVREALLPRCPGLEAVWDGPEDEYVMRLKYEVADTVAARWAVRVINIFPPGPDGSWGEG